MEQNYIEKEKNLLQKLKETNYAAFDGDRDDALNFVTDRLQTFPNYVNSVITEQMTIPMIRFRVDDPEQQGQMRMQIDRNRRICHDAAIDSVNQLNRISVLHGLPVFADIDTKDRTAVQDFCGEYVNQVYNNGIHGGMYESVKNRDREYDRSQISKRVAMIDAKCDIPYHHNETDYQLE